MSTRLMYASRLPRGLLAAQQRSFVSTGLLSRTWDSETLVELRKEAKARGLSTRGNKSTLIARIQEHEKNSPTSTSSPVHAYGTIRSASTNVVSSVPSKKTTQAASPGIPLAAQPDNTSIRPNFLAIRLPDLFQPPRNTPVQVPYVPDFWNSAQSKVVTPTEPELPKLHIVSGSATHYDGGPTHNLEKYQENDSQSTPIRANNPPARQGVGFWADFWECLGLSRSFSALSNLAAQEAKDDSQTRSRPLTDEERKGLYMLLGILGISWLVGGLVNRPAVVAEEHNIQNQH